MSGFSTEVAHAGLTFLVQTQDSGPRAHSFETLVYLKGRLVYTRRTSYTTHLDDDGYDVRLVKLVREQHRSVAEDLSAGRLDAQVLKP